jgi:hypothetical protein
MTAAGNYKIERFQPSVTGYIPKIDRLYFMRFAISDQVFSGKFTCRFLQEPDQRVRVKLKMSVHSICQSFGLLT